MTDFGVVLDDWMMEVDVSDELEEDVPASEPEAARQEEAWSCAPPVWVGVSGVKGW